MARDGAGAGYGGGVTMVNAWQEAEGVQFPFSPETDWLLTVLGETRALALHMDLSCEDAADLSTAIKARDGLDTGTPRADSRFAAVIGTGEAAIAATLDAVAFEQLEQDIAVGKPRIETRMLVDSAAGAALCARMVAEEASGSPRLLAVRPALHSRLRPLTRPPAPKPKGRGQPSAADGTVIVAIIDEGIGIANDRFRLSHTETRVQYFLDMDIELDAEGNPVPAPLERDIPLPVDATSGRVWAKEQIDGLLASEPDEPAIYHRMGLIRPGSDLRQPHAFRATHGTHVLDTAAGYDWREQGDDAAKRPIIAVQLPSRIIADRTDSEMHLALEIALDFIRTKAAALSVEINGGVPLPLVVNFSFGNYAGPQDGTSAIESRIRDFLTTYRGQAGRPGGEEGAGPPCELVLAGGNSFQAQVHARVPVSGAEPQRLTWVVEPEDGTASYAQIWLPPTQTPGQRIAVALIPPRDGPRVQVFSTLGSVLEWRTDAGVLARIYHRRDPASGREALTLCLRATFDRDPDAPVCPPGDWIIELLGTDPAETVEAACRIHRDDALAYGRREGRQSFFTDDAYRATDPVTGAPLNTTDPGDSAIRRDGTLSVYGGGTMPVVVGGYVALDGEPALYSSAGPTENPARSGPDLSAVSDEGYALQGILASGTYSGSWVRLNGTSVAAPQVTRALANSIGSGGSGYAAITAPSTPPPLPTRLGASRLPRERMGHG